MKSHLNFLEGISSTECPFLITERLTRVKSDDLIEFPKREAVFHRRNLSNLRTPLLDLTNMKTSNKRSIQFENSCSSKPDTKSTANIQFDTQHQHTTISGIPSAKWQRDMAITTTFTHKQAHVTHKHSTIWIQKDTRHHLLLFRSLPQINHAMPCYEDKPTDDRSILDLSEDDADKNPSS